MLKIFFSLIAISHTTTDITTVDVQNVDVIVAVPTAERYPFRRYVIKTRNYGER